MHIELHPEFADTVEGTRARELTSACVHCGLCLATCPTYLDSRDERDSPRGRIYLIKQLLESGSAGEQTRLHLDRCLTCRNCETSCPSGMQYGQLLDIGRGLVELEAPRGVAEKLLRRLLRFVFARPKLLRPALTLASPLRPLLPDALAARIPPRQPLSATPDPRHPRRMLLLEGCVQAAATPPFKKARLEIVFSIDPPAKIDFNAQVALSELMNQPFLFGYNYFSADPVSGRSR